MWAWNDFEQVFAFTLTSKFTTSTGDMHTTKLTPVTGMRIQTLLTYLTTHRPYFFCHLAYTFPQWQPVTLQGFFFFHFLPVCSDWCAQILCKGSLVRVCSGLMESNEAFLIIWQAFPLIDTKVHTPRQLLNLEAAEETKNSGCIQQVVTSHYLAHNNPTK